MPLVDPAAPDPAWPRYSSRAFPAYRFVPGLHPHPRRDPRGYAYGTPEVPPARVSPERWRQNEPYLFGIDLYNHAYWWACHEELEGLWHVAGRTSEEGQYLQGLIQVAAAHLKRHVGAVDGARRLAAEALEHLSCVRGPLYMGLALDPFRRAVTDFHLSERPGPFPLIRLAL